GEKGLLANDLRGAARFVHPQVVAGGAGVGPGDGGLEVRGRRGWGVDGRNRRRGGVDEETVDGAPRAETARAVAGTDPEVVLAARDWCGGGVKCRGHRDTDDLALLGRHVVSPDVVLSRIRAGRPGEGGRGGGNGGRGPVDGWRGGSDDAEVLGRAPG